MLHRSISNSKDPQINQNSHKYTRPKLREVIDITCKLRFAHVTNTLTRVIFLEF